MTRIQIEVVLVVELAAIVGALLAGALGYL